MLGVASAAGALELQGAITACHDPSRIVAHGGRYYIFSTAPNVNVRSSADLVTWEWEPQVFDYSSGMPPWMDAIAAGDNLWAPDVIERQGGGFLTFYSRNLNASSGERSVCGVATSPDIDGPFTDGQAVLDTTLSSDYYRVIDPAPIYDESGQLWLAVGSFGAPNGNGYSNGGIRLFQLDSTTAKLVTPGDDGTRIAGSWIEAAFPYRHGDYYYLFFNEAVCCAGLDSTYFIRVGRATSITGPYTDMEGDSLLTPTSGGSLFMGLEFSANFSGADTDPTPRSNSGSVDRERGPGHVGIARLEDGIERLTYHFYDGATGNGEPTLGLKTVLWGVDGWPRPGWDLADGTYAIGTRLNAEPDAPGLWLDAQPGSPVLAAYTGAQTQLWDIERVDVNRYVMTAHGAGQNLAIAADGGISGDGKSITLLAADETDDAQRWFIEQANDGSFRILNPTAAACLEVPDGAAAAGQSPKTFAYAAGLPRQHWFITPAGTYRLSSLHSNLDVASAAAAESAPLTQEAAAAEASQYFWFIPTLDGYTKLVNVGNSLAMTVEGGSAGDATAVITQADTSLDEQRWSIDVLTDGSRRLVPKSSGQALGVSGAATSAGASLEQQRWTHVLNQQWSIAFVSAVTELPPTSSTPVTSSAGGSGGTSGASSGGTGSGTAGAGGTVTNGSDGVAVSGGSGAKGSGPSGSAGGSSTAAANDAAGCGCRTTRPRSTPRELWALSLALVSSWCWRRGRRRESRNSWCRS